MLKSKTVLQADLDNWKLNILDVNVNNSAFIYPSTLNSVDTDFYTVVKDIVDSAFNTTDGITLSDVAGLVAALASKEPADPTILKQAQVIDNLLSTDALKPLSANQGRILSNLILSLPAANLDNYLAFGTANQVSAIELRTHVDNPAIHFTEASIDHTNILNRGVNTHAQIDTHLADSTIHFTQSVIDHTNILNVGSNTHTQIDSHISSTANPHNTTFHQTLTASSISMLKGNLLVGNNSTYITLPVGTDGLVLVCDSATATGYNFTPMIGQVNNGGNIGAGAATYAGMSGNNLTFRRLNPTTSALTIVENGNSIDFTIVPNNIAHSSLNGAGVNTHLQIDNHIANTSNPHNVSKLQIGLSNVPNIDATNCDSHISGVSNQVFTISEKNKLAGIDTSAMLNPPLTTIDVTAISAPSAYVLSATTNVSPWGFANQAELDTLIQIVRNQQVIINELVAKLT